MFLPEFFSEIKKYKVFSLLWLIAIFQKEIAFGGCLQVHPPLSSSPVPAPTFFFSLELMEAPWSAGMNRWGGDTCCSEGAAQHWDGL